MRRGRHARPKSNPRPAAGHSMTLLAGCPTAALKALHGLIIRTRSPAWQRWKRGPGCPGPARPPERRHPCTARQDFDADATRSCHPGILIAARGSWTVKLHHELAPADSWTAADGDGRNPICGRRRIGGGSWAVSRSETQERPPQTKWIGKVSRLEADGGERDGAAGAASGDRLLALGFASVSGFRGWVLSRSSQACRKLIRAPPVT